VAGPSARPDTAGENRDGRRRDHDDQVKGQRAI